MSLQETAKFARAMARQKELDPEVAIQTAIDNALENKPLDVRAENQIRDDLRNHVIGYGPLQKLMDDPEIEEIWVNRPDQIFFARAGVSRSMSVSLDQQALRVIVERMLRSTGRRLDRSSPFVDASLADGSRLHVVIPEITSKFWSVNIRKFPSRILDFRDLIASHTLTDTQVKYLLNALASNKNFLVSGATQAGKTTVLCALINEISMNQRIVSVEETFEIRIEKPDWVGLQTRQPNLEGIGEVTLRRLVKEALRMRPDRLVVGEVREAESLDLLLALNSGLPGACTVHANSARDAISKICTLALLAGQNITREFVNPTVGNCIDVVIHCKLNMDGSRKVTEIIEVSWNSTEKEIEFVEVGIDVVV